MVFVLRFLVARGDSVLVHLNRLVDAIDGATVSDEPVPLRQTVVARRGSDGQGLPGRGGPFA